MACLICCCCLNKTSKLCECAENENTNCMTCDDGPPVGSSQIPVTVIQRTKSYSNRRLDLESSNDKTVSEGNPRNKVALLPGHSLMDWIRLGNSGRDLTGIGGIPRDVTEAELAEHSNENNAWIVIRGKVYNIAPYLKFHPGGVDELMKGAGIDATKLFADVHPWVNYESILAKCLVGRLVQARAATQDDLAEAFFKMPPVSPPSTMNMCWTQTTQTVNFRFTGCGKPSHVYLHVHLRTDNHLRIIIHDTYHRKTHIFSFKPAGELEWPCRLTVHSDTGKIDVQFTKVEDVCWDRFGVPDKGHNSVVNIDETTELDNYHKVRIIDIKAVAHASNVRMFVLQFVDRIAWWIPIGHDIRIRALIDNVEISRPYTPVPALLPHAATIKQGVLNNFGPDCLCFIIKCYEEGAFTPTLFEKSVGDDKIDVGIISGDFNIEELKGIEQLYLIAAGTGITPMLRLIVWAFTNKRFVKSVKLLFLCRTEEDIIWKRDLDHLSSKESMFQVTYVLTQPPRDWCGLTGRISEEMLNNFLPLTLSDDDVPTKYFITACGPIAFTQFIKLYFHGFLTDELKIGEEGYVQLTCHSTCYLSAISCAVYESLIAERRHVKIGHVSL